MAAIVEKLSCPVCLDTIKDATLLHCGHSFCRRCIRRYDVSQPQLRDHMVCPMCRKKTVWTENRVDDLASNIAVNKVLDEHRRDSGLYKGFSRPMECDNGCDLAQLRAKHCCKECKKFMCDVCLKDHGVEFKDHKVENLLHIFTQMRLNSIPSQEELMEDMQLKVAEARLRCKTKIQQLRENRGHAATIDEQHQLINECMKKLEEYINKEHEKVKNQLLEDKKRVTLEVEALDYEINRDFYAKASTSNDTTGITGDQSEPGATAGTSD